VTCEELKALAPAWALGALDEEERLACEAHLATPRLHEGCESAVAQAEQAAQVLAWALPPQSPPESVWDKIEEQLAEQARATMRRESVLPGWSRFAGALALAASVAVIFLLLGGHLGRQEGAKTVAAMKESQSRAAGDLSLAQTSRAHIEGQFEACQRDLKAASDSLDLRQRALGLLAEPATEVVALAPQAKFSSGGSVILNRNTHRAIVFAKSLAKVTNRDYEVWVIRKGDKIPAGILKVEPGGSSLALISESLLQTDADAFAITLEPAGGGPVPKGPAVLVGQLKKG